MAPNEILIGLKV